ncbi:ferritin [Desulfotomaculum copahuensis]|uniref:Ferritin n=1 Tax=Desulfotomaculum copahuensis TaxID=1838280 RepID=A0A1B7LCL5_9FIRM|nr:ferritin [Desulfotomaculum copahuensis]OAT80425.1 ferritin [Desulfotomaculum copahuensis]
MLPEKLLQALNEQITYELYSAHLYLSMAAYCAGEELNGFVNFFKVQTEEEKFHAMKFFDFINDRNGRVRLGGLDEPPADFASLPAVFEKAYAHEQMVTGRIYRLMDIATEEKEHATISFLKWFIDEQVEEESTFNGIIVKLKRISDDSTGLYNLDAELATRVFTPPAPTV